ncbi:hypothetical protein C3495_14630 (plasmid) [Clostridiaceae bacterium 14S0207]|nr:hypothetical protein C3495_14630 [Clostridiaceae bacterium 14S0207]
MLTLVAFEMKKFLNRKKNLVIILLFMSILFIFVGLNASIESQMKVSEISSIEDQIKSIENALIGIDDEIEKLPNNNDIVYIKKSYTEDMETLKKQKEAYKENDAFTYLKFKLKLDKKLLSDIQSQKVISGKDPEEIKMDIKINSILLKKKIQPIYDKVSMKGYNFIKIVLNSPLTLTMMIVVIMLSADIISSEIEFNTYKLLYTQPISKNSILFSKAIAVTIVVNVIIFSIITLFFFILGIKNGFGDLNYPTQFFVNGKLQFVTIGEYIVFELIMLLLVNTFICILSTFISIFCSNIGTSISITLIISVSLYMIINQGFISKIAPLIPITYIDISNILQGNMIKISQNINVFNGIKVLCISILMLLFTGIVFFQKECILKVKKDTSKI